MKILMMYDYPPTPGGLSTQGNLLHEGLLALGVDVLGVHLESTREKEWYYRWFEPDVSIGIGYWGHTPHLVLHPQVNGIQAVPWLVADGYVANYRDVLNSLPLILVTSNWVKEVYIRDGIREEIIDVLPVGCNTDLFVPRDRHDPEVAAVREVLGISPDEVMLLTIGGDAASKGGQEVMRGLAALGGKVPDWRYVCKVWPQPRTARQNELDLKLAAELGIAGRMVFMDDRGSRNFIPYLIAACDIYAAPSRLEGFGMGQVEAGACGRPVLGIEAMGMLDTLVHGQTALLARVAVENRIRETILGPECGYEEGHRVVFDVPRIADYRADVEDVADHLLALMTDPALRDRLGAAGRRHVVEHFDYRVVARRLLQILSERLGIS